FEAWVDADRNEKRLQRQLEQLQQESDSAVEATLRKQLSAVTCSKDRLLHASPLWRIGRFLLDMVLIFHLRRGDMCDYAELALGEEADLVPDPQRDMGAFLLSLLRAAVSKRFGNEAPQLTLTPQYMKALIFRLKVAHNIEGLCERRRRRARPKTFSTSLCKAAVAAGAVAAAGSGGNCGTQLGVQTPQAAEDWQEESDVEGLETEEGGTGLVNGAAVSGNAEKTFSACEDKAERPLDLRRATTKQCGGLCFPGHMCGASGKGV
ncbi:uncharacterized protein LOC113146735, partial [Cyclospora cayetanensis]|uniref:Uncharacterized protein LOC113146735 n=1 Tax=Cyclospora cayetanensis TaxID=88456 RepID=A0A6P6RUF7_9EIME